MAEVLMAAKNGMPTLGNRRIRVRKGETTAHADHEIVTRYPHLWRPIEVEYATSGDATPPTDDEAFRGALDASGLKAWDLIRHLCAELVRRGIEITPPVEADTPDEDVARAVVETAIQSLDDAGYEVQDDGDAQPETPAETPAETPDPVPDEDPSERRAKVRDWARANGHDVSDRGPLPKDVEKAYEDAHAAG